MLGRLLFGLLLAVLLVVVSLLSPVAYVELACRGTPVADAYAPILPPEDRRPEARTLMTYPEWDIVHAYEDYAEVIAVGDPHDFGFLRAVRNFWGSACALNRAAAAHGGADWTARQTVHVIGISFTAEMALKALYEETVGRAATWIRGPVRSHLDDVSARQAAAYAAFLHQVPWYRWDFERDRAELLVETTRSFRDNERDFALGVEYGVKAAYAKAIGAAVAATGNDALTLRSIVTGLAPDALAAIPGVTVVQERPEGVEIETPRYEEFNALARTLAARGARFVEIAGNDDILLSVITDGRAAPADRPALMAMPRQGNPGWRQLVLVKVADLSAALTDPRLTVEHVHDY